MPRRNAPAPIAMDFVRLPRRPGWLAWAGLVFGIASLGAAAYSLYSERSPLERLEASVAQQREQVRALRGASPTAPLPVQAVEPARKVAAELNAPWAMVFAELANARIDGVAVRELVADAGRGSLRLVGEARTLDLAFDYVDLVQAGGFLRNVVVENHEWTSDSGAGLLRFTMTAQWGSAGGGQ